MSTIELSAEQVRWYRLRRSGLIDPFDSPETAASTLAGIQAQILPAAALALWNRTRGLTNETFEALLYTERTLVKLWGQRRTLHVYASRDWPLINGALSWEPTWWEKGIARDGGDVEAHRATIVKLAGVLRRKQRMNRNDLRLLEQDGFDLGEDFLSSWGGAFKGLVWQGFACHAERIGSEGQFVHRQVWLPDLKWDPPAPDAANVELLRRYLHAFGPATAADFAFWRQTNQRLTRGWLAALEEEVGEVWVEGKPMFALASDLDTLCESPPPRRVWPIHMLYRFDPLLLPHKDKNWIIDTNFYKRVWRPAGHIEGVILEHGRIIGTWRYDRKGRGLVVTVHPFKKLTRRMQTAVARQAKKIARFFDAPLSQLNMVYE